MLFLKTEKRFTVWDRKNSNNIIGMGEKGGASPVAAMRWH